MSLSPGTRLGPYEILAAIGTGGMGEVYRARDTRLDRTVAIKVLPSILAADPHFRDRFDREARAISALEHPSICALYDLGRERDVDFLVMQYLEGETLAARLGRGRVPLPQALRIGVEIANALAAAHRRGIVHRDLKPGNVMLTKAGAKLLDFGLASPTSPVGSSGEHAFSDPTVAQPLTTPGTLLGTVQYMAPEQVERGTADPRTDLFALGAVLYEMIAGRRAFDGDNPATLMSAILRDQPPPLSKVHPPTPPAIDQTIGRCLAKDPDDRWQSASDLAAQLQWVAEGASQAPGAASVGHAAPRRSYLALGALVAAGGVALFFAGLAIGARYLTPSPPASTLVRFGVPAPPDARFTPAPVSGTAQFALSPDGARLAFVASSASGTPMLWVRDLDGITPRQLAGTDEASMPFWSPDGRSLGFFARGKVWRIEAAGGQVKQLADAPTGRGGDWSVDGTIVFSSSSGFGLFRVPAAGGATTAATDFVPNSAQSRQAEYWPCFLPDGKRFLFFVLSADPAKRGIYAGSLDSTNTSFITASDSMVRYADGHLFSVQQGTLYAEPFDASRLVATGPRRQVAERVDYFRNFGLAAFGVSNGSVLAYARGIAPESQLTWFDRQGRAIGTIGPAGLYTDGPVMSQDGRRVATAKVDTQTDTPDLWLHDLARGSASRVTFEGMTEFFPVFSPDAARLFYSSDRSGLPDLYVTQASGSGANEPLADPGKMRMSNDVSADGRLLIYQESTAQGYDLHVLTIADRTTKIVLKTPFNEAQGRLSPDGRWIAYTSDESGELEVYVQPFPPTGSKWAISTGGGSQPEWRRDGKELFYVSSDRRLMAVTVKSGRELEAGIPQPLFALRTRDATAPFFRFYAASADGQRFLVNTLMPTSTGVITVVTNWKQTPEGQ